MTRSRDTLFKAGVLALIYVLGTAASIAYAVFWRLAVMQAKVPAFGVNFLKALWWYAVQIPIAPMLLIAELLPQLGGYGLLLNAPFWMVIGYGIHRLWRKHYPPPTPWV